MTERTILLADDDPRLLRALAVRLEAEGFRVVAARDGADALRLAAEARPDLLLLDVDMPAADGIAVKERLEETDRLRGIPVIYLTGERLVRASYGSREVGAAALLYKPIDADVLLRAVHGALAGEPGQERPRKVPAREKSPGDQGRS